MQCPQRNIYYELRISLLEGEKTPFYPDYLKDNSNNPGEDFNFGDKNQNKTALRGNFN
jgi:hypothetical protein